MPSDTHVVTDNIAILESTSALRALANPTRMRVLGLLRTSGPMTVTDICDIIGIASGSASYHLRQLEQVGLVEQTNTEDEDSRKRWWKARHQAMSPPKHSSDQDSDSTIAYKRSVSQTYRDIYTRFLDNVETLENDWVNEATNLDTAMSLTLDEFKDMNAELEEVLHRWMKKTHEKNEETRQIALIIQTFPWLP